MIDFERVFFSYGEKEVFRDLTLHVAAGKRAALARALCRDAALYLLGEPFSGLNTENAARAAELVNRVTAEKTVLVATHHGSEAELLGCRTTIRPNIR